jgi:hypothetical protein
MHHQDPVPNVKLNTECGASFSDFTDVQAVSHMTLSFLPSSSAHCDIQDDELVCFEMEQIARERL